MQPFQFRLARELAGRRVDEQQRMRPRFGRHLLLDHLQAPRQFSRALLLSQPAAQPLPGFLQFPRVRGSFERLFDYRQRYGPLPEILQRRHALQRFARQSLALPSGQHLLHFRDQLLGQVALLIHGKADSLRCRRAHDRWSALDLRRHGSPRRHAAVVERRSTTGIPVQRVRVPLVVERRDDIALVLPVVTVERAAHAR